MPEKFGLPSDIRGGACAKARFASTTRAINEANIEFRTYKSPFRARTYMRNHKDTKKGRIKKCYLRPFFVSFVSLWFLIYVPVIPKRSPKYKRAGKESPSGPEASRGNVGTLA